MVVFGRFQMILKRMFPMLVVVCAVLAAVAAAAEPVKAFPEAQGWAAYTPGGRGGRTIRVTNLNAGGPGSFAEAVHAKGPRTVVFEVGGIIDLEKESIMISEPFLTVSGESAPSPGITFIRGGINIVATHDVIIRHIRVRPGKAGAAKKSEWDVDAIATDSSYNIVVDHCSCTWATDENLSASGPRFIGETVEEWRKNTSHRVTFSNCLIAECLRSHSMGSLIHDNATEIAIIGNLFVSNVKRHPYFKGGATGVVVNNYIFNPGDRAIMYALIGNQWKGRKKVTGQMAIVGNVMEYGADTESGVPLFRLHGDGPVEVYLKDNVARDRAGKDVDMIGFTSSLVSRETKGPPEDRLCRRTDAAPLWPEGLEARPGAEVKDYVLKNAGARPWDRDETDMRIIRGVLDGTARIIDSEQEVEGYPR